MDWPTRVKIAAGAARGIAYLHEDCNIFFLLLCLQYQMVILKLIILYVSLGHPRIIHRDIKSSNILLDNNFEAQVISNL